MILFVVIIDITDHGRSYELFGLTREVHEFLNLTGFSQI